LVGILSAIEKFGEALIRYVLQVCVLISAWTFFDDK